MSYYGRIITLWDDILTYDPLPPCSCKPCKCDWVTIMDARREKKRARDFLMGLDARFDNARSQILSINPLPNLNLIYNRLLLEEGLRNLSRNSTESNPDVMAFASRAYNPSRQSGGARDYHHNRNAPYDRNSQSGGGRHYQSTRPSHSNYNYVSTENTRPFCIACKRSGHNFTVCYRATGNFPEWWGDCPRDRIYINPNDTDLSKATFVPDVHGRAAYDRIRQTNHAAAPRANMAAGQTVSTVPAASSSSSLPVMDNVDLNALNASELAELTRLWQAHKIVPTPERCHGPFLEDGDWCG